MKNNTTRIKLINAIIEYAGDEHEDKQSLIQLASMSEEELINEVLSTLAFYYRKANES